MKKVEVWKCDYCPKRLINITQMREHEKRCFRNPETKSCITCKNLNSADFDVIENEVEFFEHHCSSGVNLKFGLKTQCRSWDIKENYKKKISKKDDDSLLLTRRQTPYEENKHEYDKENYIIKTPKK